MWSISIYPSYCPDATVSSGYKTAAIETPIIEFSTSDTKHPHLIILSNVESSGACLLEEMSVKCIRVFIRRF
jgi:hypothetical protein